MQMNAGNDSSPFGQKRPSANNTTTLLKVPVWQVVTADREPIPENRPLQRKAYEFIHELQK